MNINTNNNISAIVKQQLCVGCGICTIVCPQNCIVIDINSALGIFYPIIDFTRCLNCGSCLKVCPGYSVDFIKLNKTINNNDYSCNILGNYKIAYFAHSNDDYIRYHSSSGGIITTILIYALESGLIDGAVVTKMNSNNPFIPTTFVATKKEQILEAYGSKYCPTSIGLALKELENLSGKYAIVCLPCQMHAIRKLENQHNQFKDKIKLHLGLFCGHNNTFLATDYFLKRYKISKDDINKFVFRDEGWPGKLIIEFKNSPKKEFLRVRNESSLMKRLIFSYTYHRDFYIPRCLLCPDLTNELSDISFGDAWHKKYLGKEKIGKSISIVRNEIGASLLNEVIAKDIISSDKINGTAIRESQKPQYKENVGVRLLLATILGKKVPKYHGKKYSISILNFIRYTRITPYLTHYKLLWSFWDLFFIPRHILLKILKKLFGRM